MKVKIIKASRDTYWYATEIGKVFEVEPKICREKFGKNHPIYRLKGGGVYVDVDDVEIIDAEEKVLFS